MNDYCEAHDIIATEHGWKCRDCGSEYKTAKDAVDCDQCILDRLRGEKEQLELEAAEGRTQMDKDERRIAALKARVEELERGTDIAFWLGYDDGFDDSTLDQPYDDHKAAARYGYRPAEDRELEVVTRLTSQIRALKSELSDWQQSAERAAGEMCGDERHCSCVPVLRRQVEELVAENECFRSEGMKHHAESKCGPLCPWCEISRLGRRVEELERDLKRSAHYTSALEKAQEKLIDAVRAVIGDHASGSDFLPDLLVSKFATSINIPFERVDEAIQWLVNVGNSEFALSQGVTKRIIEYGFKLLESLGIERCGCGNGLIERQCGIDRFEKLPCHTCTRPGEERGCGWVVKS